MSAEPKFIIEHDWKPPPRCGEVRGGARSKVACEALPGHRDDHIGRGRTGQWFMWRNEAVPTPDERREP